MTKNRYIHQIIEWPNFSWNVAAVNELLFDIRHEQGRLIGGMESIGFNFKQEAILETLTQDVIKTSEIEGEVLEHIQVRSSVAKRLGIEDAAIIKSDKSIDGIVEMMLDATQNFDHLVTKKRILGWHSLLFPSGKRGLSQIKGGQFRLGPVQVVSGQLGDEEIHFDAPEGILVPCEMSRFLDWFKQNQGLDSVLKSAIAHFWFVTIHPFEDGNGRIGRALADLLLARSEKSSRRFYSLSAQIQKERRKYYAILESSQKGDLDITQWIIWFLNCLNRAIQQALVGLEKAQIKNDYWKRNSNFTVNIRQKKILNLLLDDFKGNLTSSKWAKINNCSQDTASRDIVDLINKNILVKNPEGGRSTSYRLK